MANGIRLDLQRALAEGPGAIPNLEPLFAPGAIPPVFDEAPEVEEGPGFIPGGGIPGVSTGTFTGEPIDIGSGSIGQPVPPVKQSRGHRLRALLGNFLQNFGEGLQAASRAPSGAEFAAGLGGALSAPEERRRQQMHESLLRARQAFREQFDRERADREREEFEFTQRQAKAADIKSDLALASAERKTFQERLTARTQRAVDFVAGRKRRAQEFEQKKELIRLGDKLAREREGLKPPTFSERRAAQRQRVNTMGAAFFLQTGGDARASAKLLREKLEEDPKGFAAQHFNQIMQVIRSSDLSNATEILLNRLREQPP